MTTEKLIKIAIVDDHIFIREGIRKILSHKPEFKVIADYARGSELLAMLEELRGDPMAEGPDIIILDIQLQDISGYEIMETLREFPGIKVLVSSMFDNEISIIKMLQRGATGFLPKSNTRPKEMIAALKKVAEGELYCPDYISEEVVERIKKGHSRVGLTEREIEFLKYCCEDLGYKEIAARMDIKERTAHGYRDALFLKLNVKSRAGLILYAVRAGLLMQSK